MSVFLWKTPMDKSIYSKRYSVFLSLLREARQSQDITQSALAEKLAESQSVISKCERGERRMDIVELLSWCDAVGVSFVEFSQRLETEIIAKERNGII